jgi:hypothetical protein
MARRLGAEGHARRVCQRVNALMQETMHEPAVAQRLTVQLLKPVTCPRLRVGWRSAR